MTRSSTGVLVLCALAGAMILPAQDDPQPAYVPLTLEQNYLFSLNKVVGSGGLALVGMKASFDQAFDHPRQWGSGADSYAVRFASRFGRSFVRQNIAFGVRALDGEDPRYFVSGQGGRWQRTKYAIGHTFAAHNAHGGLMPAYGLLVSDYATPLIANQWRPNHDSATRAFGIGSLAVGISVGSSIWQEFWPDLRKKLHGHENLPFFRHPAP